MSVFSIRTWVRSLQTIELEVHWSEARVPVARVLSVEDVVFRPHPGLNVLTSEKERKKSEECTVKEKTVTVPDFSVNFKEDLKE